MLLVPVSKRLFGGFSVHTVQAVQIVHTIHTVHIIRVAESVAKLPRRSEPSKDLVSQSLSSKLTCEREMAQKALELLLTAQNAFEREREISSQGS